ncbi:hypothetical protein ABMA28_004335 [Loxostege sticticalis]|uniref:Reverse transcriptase domain-containing protein n=1 Tax=Loxostege sticticalis TaxID=481309 RepID=A0ABD0SQT7_LOXSC
MSESEKKITREITDDLLKNGIIRHSNSPYASPALLVDKGSGGKRLCVDYRQLNKITVKEKYPMPIIEDLIDRLQGCKYFTSLDLKSGYHQIKIKPEAIPKTAFITPDGHFEYLRMPFGLSNGPSVFQRLMNTVLGSLRFEALRSMGANSDNNKWDQYITNIQQGINSTINKTTSAVPSEVFFGYRIRMNNDGVTDDNIEDTVDLTALRKKVDENIQKVAEKQKATFDAKRKEAPVYKVGDLVVIKIPSMSNDGQSTKLLPRYKGPFQVTEILGHDRYRVADMRGAERSTKRYNGVSCVENMKPWIKIADADTPDVIENS